jgi:ABC-type polysaccharide/polyol phosphate export permease
VISSLINMTIGLAVALCGLVYFAYVRPETVDTAALQLYIPPEGRPLAVGPSLLALPLLMVLQAMFTVGIGYFLAAFNLFLRDTYHVIGVLLTVWMFATPIFYPPAMVQDAGFGWILDLNPMYWLIENYRAALFYGVWPEWGLVGRFAFVAVAVLLLGSSFFMAQKPRFPDLL